MKTKKFKKHTFIEGLKIGRKSYHQAEILKGKSKRNAWLAGYMEIYRHESSSTESGIGAKIVLTQSNSYKDSLL
jgi:hypothetical protein